MKNTRKEPSAGRRLSIQGRWLLGLCTLTSLGACEGKGIASMPGSGAAIRRWLAGSALSLIILASTALTAGCGGKGAPGTSGLPQMIGEIPRDEFLTVPPPSYEVLEQALQNLGWFNPEWRPVDPKKPGLSRALFDEVRRLSGTGMSRSEFLGVNKNEWMLLIAKYPGLSVSMFLAMKEAEGAVRRYYHANCDETRGNAFKHAYWNFVMAKFILQFMSADPNDPRYGFPDVTRAAEMAKEFSDAHESLEPEGPRRDMDYVNNGVGLELFRTHPSLSLEEVAQRLIDYPAELVPDPSTRFGRTDALVYIDLVGSCAPPAYWQIDGAIHESGWRGWSNPNATIQLVPFDVPIGSSGSWSKEADVQYGAEFSGHNFVMGNVTSRSSRGQTVAESFKADLQAEYKLNHAGGGMIAFAEMNVTTVARVYVSPYRDESLAGQRYRLQFSGSAALLSSSTPNDGRPGTNSQRVDARLEVNGTRYDFGTTHLIEVSASNTETTIDGKKYYHVATIAVTATAAGGFTAIIGVPPLETLAKSLLGVEARLLPFAVP